MHSSYDPKNIEKKWQQYWEENGIYKTDDSLDKPKSYVLDMFPYPSGVGLHVGHPKGYIATDILSRMRRMQGFNVLHPMGFDAFGLPAEQYAIKTKTNPKIGVAENVQRYKEQLEILGMDYDWSREINTTDPNYYKWTQWAFLKMYEKGLVYESHEPINWCPSCLTGLANEDLESDGTCERCGSVVERRPMRQWVIKITEYADRLLDDLELLPNWPNSVKEAQRAWIGRSEGAELSFKISDGNEELGEIQVFTTRPDTLYGVTYVTVAPEHGLIHKLEEAIKNLNEVKNYIESVKNKSDLDRQQDKEKTGVALDGLVAIHPITGDHVPVWVADYVLASYGTGAVMAVPAHDERDYAFAKAHDLPIKQVIETLDFNTGPGLDAFQEGTEIVPRNNVLCIIKHPSEDKFLCVSWKGVAWNGFVTGGIEEGATIEQTALEELTEETGYQNAKVTKVLDHGVHSLFYHVNKKVNRNAHYRILEVTLGGLEQVERSEEEAAIHDLVWLDRDEVASFLTRPDMQDAWSLYISDEDRCMSNPGHLVNSEEFSGMRSVEVMAAITEKAGGKMTKTLRLNDWVFSRQRYWGEPIPLVHCEKCGVVPVPESELPVELPDVENYEPTGTGESPLAAIDDWVNVDCPECGGPGKRETNTMPQWAGSSWYYLRYMDPHNDAALVDPTKEKYFAPVDVYVGGMEHAARHLIYARFWHKFLADIDVVSTPEPFTELHTVGLVMAEDGRKMSKRWGNVVNPDDMVEQFGADSLRTYTMFMGPFENAIPWSTDGIVGVRRFLEKVWRIADLPLETSSPEVVKLLHKTIKKVTEDIPAFRFNTCVSQMMILASAIEKSGDVAKTDFAKFALVLAPFAPHLTEELWHRFSDGSTSIHQAKWPEFDPELVVDDTVTIAIQINGKVRDEVTLPVDADEINVKSLVLDRDKVTHWTKDATIQKFIYVPGRIINIVVK